MVAPAKKIWRNIGLDVAGGVLSYPISNGVVLLLGTFIDLPAGIAATVFISTYSGMVVVCIYRLWTDVRALTNDVRILVILNEENANGAETAPQPTSPRMFDDETYEVFQRMLSGFPPEYSVIKLNRLFFMEGLASLPSPKLQELVNNQKAFSQLLGCLKNDEYIRTDGHFFTVQLSQSEAKRQQLKECPAELQEWQKLATGLIEKNKR
ncbi:MAG: hypothetical protein A3F83_11700 [Candidatus Glassbacteria bacterium RIFCSPLOWO2_12_FULL_58_11]|uniref:Uncharacterized protein n=1 Tax=Candidatus Glassbacteria bacterium RIFCSPLOWO2_12_FULL_58_11 TaxID=1817867 RepID=A0A1F5Z317_9BACT|nr:MAG: hypothetical protein A3F83_11700 [Candidatus Glassbacteria bacterium RIFCSPLOWO2_12_FULL_58_11]